MGDSADLDFGSFLNTGVVPGTDGGGGALDLASLGLSQADLASLNLGTSPQLDPHTTSLATLASASIPVVQASNVTAIARKGASNLARIGAAILRIAGPSSFVAVAGALGLDAVATLTAVVKSKGKRRRSRGVSGRDMKNARRTIRVVTGMYHKLEHSFPRHRAPVRALPHGKRK